VNVRQNAASVFVRLKCGDPGVIRDAAQEEIDALKANGIDFEIGPRVTAACAAAASTVQADR